MDTLLSHSLQKSVSMMVLTKDRSSSRMSTMSVTVSRNSSTEHVRHSSAMLQALQGGGSSERSQGDTKLG